MTYIPYPLVTIDIYIIPLLLVTLLYYEGILYY